MWHLHGFGDTNQQETLISSHIKINKQHSTNGIHTAIKWLKWCRNPFQSINPCPYDIYPSVDAWKSNFPNSKKIKILCFIEFTVLLQYMSQFCKRKWVQNAQKCSVNYVDKEGYQMSRHCTIPFITCVPINLVGVDVLYLRLLLTKQWRIQEFKNRGAR